MTNPPRSILFITQLCNYSNGPVTMPTYNVSLRVITLAESTSHCQVCGPGDLWTWGSVDWGSVDLGICGPGDLCICWVIYSPCCSLISYPVTALKVSQSITTFTG